MSTVERGAWPQRREKLRTANIYAVACLIVQGIVPLYAKPGRKPGQVAWFFDKEQSSQALRKFYDTLDALKDEERETKETARNERPQQ